MFERPDRAYTEQELAEAIRRAEAELRGALLETTASARLPENTDGPRAERRDIR